MNLQWILLALFLIAIVRNVAKALRNPMLKNFLRLLSILVAFIITFILQICGVFQNIAGKVVGSLELAAMVPEFEGAINSVISMILPFCTTLLSPLIFTLTFLLLFWCLQLIHVNLTYKYIIKRRRKKEIKEFKALLRDEKVLLKKAITDNEERFKSIMDSIALANPDIDTYDYEALDEDEIEKMVEKRIKLEKKKKKKSGFFKESSERKAISMVCGVVSGFLLFGILWMGFFYTMDILSDVTDGIKDTNAEDTKIYQVVEMIDDHLVTPYEESFVYKLYDSMAMVDLMNFTVKAGGKLDINGEVYYADDIMRDHMTRSVRLACEITSATSDKAHVGEDVDSLVRNPITVNVMAEFIVALVDSVEVEDMDDTNALNAIYGSIIANYQGENGKELIIKDLDAVSEIVVIASNNKLLAMVIADASNLEGLLEERELITELAVAMSKLSFYGSTMESAFTLVVDAMGTTLMPADNAAAYEAFLANIVNSADGLTDISNEDLGYFYAFVKNVATYEKSENNTSGGILAYIADPLYRAELLRDDANDIKARVEQLEQDAQDYWDNVEALKADIEAFKADIDALTAELESAAVEIAALELKKIEYPENFTTEDQERLDYFYGLQSKKGDFEAQVADFELQAADLEARAHELEDRALELEEDVQDLADKASAYVTDFEERIKGLTPFITYFLNWTNVQKPFMLAGEDKSSACMAVNIDGTIYVCNTDILNIEMLVDIIANGGIESIDVLDGEGTEEDSDILDTITVAEYLDKIPMKDLIEQLTVTNDEASMGDRVSALTDLVNYIILAANNVEETITEDWVYETLVAYLAQENNPEACNSVATKIVGAFGNHVNFEYNGVTVEKMKVSLHFGDDEWTIENKEADSEKLVDIIFTLVDLMQTMGNNEESENANASEMETLLGLLVTLGKTMDQMSDTYCLNEMPSIMVEGILKNQMLSMAMTPSMLYGETGYMSRLESGELTYEELMREISDLASTVLDKLGNNNEEEAE